MHDILQILLQSRAVLLCEEFDFWEASFSLPDLLY
jgi:hypothetical protein